MEYIIIKSTRAFELIQAKKTEAYSGDTCEDAGIEKGRVYTTKFAAMEDARKLTEYNKVGFLVVKVNNEEPAPPLKPLEITNSIDYESIALALCAAIQMECGDYTEGALDTAIQALKKMGWSDNDIRLWKRGELIITESIE